MTEPPRQPQDTYPHQPPMQPLQPPMQPLQHYGHLLHRLNQTVYTQLSHISTKTQHLQNWQQKTQRAQSTLLHQLHSLLQAKIEQKMSQAPPNTSSHQLHPQHQTKPSSTEQSNDQANPCLKHNSFLDLKSSELEVYVCFICLRQRQGTPCMWENCHEYLSHMRHLHRLEPEFELLLRGKSIYGSHAYFQGLLTNLTPGLWYPEYVPTCYLLAKGRYDQLYFCGCSIHDNRTGFFSSPVRFLKHIQSKQHKTRYLSHIQQIKGPRTVLQENPEFEEKCLEKQAQSAYSHLETKLYSIISRRGLASLLVSQPLNILELASTYPNVLDKQDLYPQLFFCQICNQSFFSEKSFLKHKKINHPTDQQQLAAKTNCCKFKAEDLPAIVRTQQKKLVSYRVVACLMETIDVPAISQHNDCLFGELLLIQQHFRPVTRNKIYLICGNCHEMFTNNYEGYLLHIYLQHEVLHPLNSHSLKFLNKRLQQNYEDEENDDS